jgi:hypothetical protein
MLVTMNMEAADGGRQLERALALLEDLVTFCPVERQMRIITDEWKCLGEWRQFSFKGLDADYC